MPGSRIASRVAWGLAALALAACGAAAIGFFFGAEWGWALFAAMLLVALLNHLRQLLALGRWLEHGEAPEGHRASGVWDELRTDAG